MELKEIKQSLTLEEVFPTTEILEEIDKSLEEYKRVGYNKFLEILPSMKDNQHHITCILHDFEDCFMRKKSAKDESYKFFKFVSPTINTWAQHILQGMSNFISNHTLEDLHRSKPMIMRA